MHKPMLALILVAVLGLSSVAVAAGETFGNLPVVRILVNGKALSTPGVVVEGRSMAPVRAVAESLGGDVGWDQATFTATITAPDLTDLKTEVAALKAEVERLQTENAQLKAKLQPAAPTAEPWNGVSTRTNPAGINNTQTIFVKSIMGDYTAKVTLLEVLRGDEAWQKVQAANPFNSPPGEGKEYIAARFRFELVTIADDKALDVNTVQFQAVSGSGREYDPLLSVIDPEPSLDTALYAGASHEGWATFAVDKTDTAPVVAYGLRFDGTGGIWFSLATE